MTCSIDLMNERLPCSVEIVRHFCGMERQTGRPRRTWRCRD